jgi:hypothetical protein
LKRTNEQIDQPSQDVPYYNNLQHVFESVCTCRLPAQPLTSSQVKALQNISHSSGVSDLKNWDERWANNTRVLTERKALHDCMAHHLALDGVLHFRQQRLPARFCFERLRSERVRVALALDTRVTNEMINSGLDANGERLHANINVATSNQLTSSNRCFRAVCADTDKSRKSASFEPR